MTLERQVKVAPWELDGSMKYTVKTKYKGKTAYGACSLSSTPSPH